MGKLEAALTVAAGGALLLAGCAGELGAAPASSLVMARPTASPESFALQMNAAVRAVDQALVRVLGLLSEPHYLDDDWRQQMVSAAMQADLGYRQLEELIPPDAQRENHEAAVAALNGCQDLTSFALKGISNLDKGPFDEAAARAEFCRTKLEVATRAPGSAEAQALPESIEAVRQTIRLTVTRDANLRGGPGTTYPRVATAATGDQFTVTGRTEKGDWLRISGAKVKEAWIAAFLCKIDGELQSVPLAQ